MICRTRKSLRISVLMLSSWIYFTFFFLFSCSISRSSYGELKFTHASTATWSGNFKLLLTPNLSFHLCRQLGDPSYLSWNRNPGGHWSEKLVMLVCYFPWSQGSWYSTNGVVVFVHECYPITCSTCQFRCSYHLLQENQNTFVCCASELNMLYAPLTIHSVRLYVLVALHTIWKQLVLLIV